MKKRSPLQKFIPIPQQLSPMSVALLYAAFATLWIIASGNLLIFAVNDATLQGHIELAKGLAFVAVTSGLLYLLLKGWHRTLIDPANVLNADIRPLAISRLALLFAALVMIVPLIGLAITTLYGPKIEREAYANLEAIAKLKTEQIENWLSERQDDSRALAVSPGFVEHVDKFIKQQAAPSREAIQKQLNLLRTIHSYDSTLLLDTRGQLLLALGEHNDMTVDLQRLLRQSLAGKQIQRGDLYRDEAGNIHMDWVAPIFIADAQGEHAIAAVVLRVTAQHFLFPLIQACPTSSPSAETLLVRQDDGSALFMNTLRHRDNTALSLRLPLTKPSFPAAAAILSGQAGIAKGFDYRNIEVLSAYRPVKDTNWHLIAKIDLHEVLAPLRELVLWISLVALTAITAISTALLLLWRQQQRAQSLALLVQKTKAEDKLSIADASLQQSMERTQALINSALDAIISMDQLGRVIAWNPQAEVIFGYSQDQAIGCEVAELIVPTNYRDAHRQGIARFIETGSLTIMGNRIEIQGMRSDGSEFPIELAISTLTQNNEQFFSAYIRDISTRKQAEEEIRSSKTKLEAALASMNDAVFISDFEGRFVNFNDTFATFHRFKSKEECAKTFAEYPNFIDVYSTGGELVPMEQWAVPRALRGESATNAEFILRRKATDESWVGSYSYAPIRNNDGVIVGSVVTARDISERKQLENALVAKEKEFRLLAESMPQIVWITNADGEAIYINQQWVDYTGLTLEESYGPGWNKPFHPDDQKRAWNAWQNAINNNVRYSLECQLRRADGTYHWWLIRGLPLLDESGKVYKWFGTCTDIHEIKEAEKTLRDKERLLADSQAIAHIGSWMMDIDTGAVNWSDETFRLLGLPPLTDKAPMLDQFFELLHPDDRQSMQDWINACISGKFPPAMEFRTYPTNDACLWLLVNGVLETNANTEPLRIIGTVQDITERKQAENELRIAATAFESHEAMLITDANQIILKVNQGFTRITGYSAEEAIGNTPTMLKSDKQDQQFYDAMWKDLNRDKFWQGELWNRRKNGELYAQWLSISSVTDTTGQVSNYVAAFGDITAIKKSEETIHNLAFYDPLTKLPNRRLLIERLQQALNSSSRHLNHGAILFIDLDNFKELNDTKGYDVGDLLLIEVAKRLKLCARSNDTIACLGGDDFVVVLEDLSIEADQAAIQAESIAEKIRISISQPFTLQELEYHNASSIGISLFRNHEISVDDLLKHADTAMYQAKQSGRNTIRFFDPATHAAMEARIALEAELRLALPGNQFRLYYQMQVDNTGKILGAEVLIRWQHPERGLVSPAQFIPLTEENGLIVPIGQWVLETACAQIKRWETDTNTRHLQLAVNVSALQFRQPDFVEQVCGVLEKTAINPDNLKLELTESLVLENVNDTITKIQALKKLGIHFSMDDFGTGYSSLAYLSKLPLEQLKIDQSFVYNIDVKTSDAVIVQTIIGMAKNLDMEVIAEGVETEQQRDFLQRNGCTRYQGYLFSKPVPLEEFEQLLCNA